MNNNISLPARWRFWESYADAIEVLAGEDRQKAKDFLFAIYEYSSWGREPDLDFSDPMTKMAWALVKPNLESSVARHANGKAGGKKGGRPKKQKTPELDSDALADAMAICYEPVPDDVLESQAAYMSDEYEREREALRQVAEAEAWIG
jgi:hypothetical protein